jgi:hypothetical protein
MDDAPIPVQWGCNKLYRVDGVNGELLSYAYAIVWTPLFALRLHIYYCVPPWQHPHDHAWKFWKWSFISWILRGGYTEAIYHDLPVEQPSRIRKHKRWSMHVMPHGIAHLFTEIAGVTWTLILAGPDDPSGFTYWVNGTRINVADYDAQYMADKVVITAPSVRSVLVASLKGFLRSKVGATKQKSH